MKNLRKINLSISCFLLLITYSISQNEIDPDNTLEEKTHFTILEKEGKTQYFGQVYKNKRKGIGTEFLNNGQTQTGYFENDQFLGEYIVSPPWHMVDIDYNFINDVEFEKISVDVNIKNKISKDEFLYISPLCSEINGIQFYAGIQTQCGGYQNSLHNEEKSEYYEIGKALIFSRWETRDIKGFQKAPNGVCESSGYEGDFISVRNSFEWDTGTYTLSLINTHETIQLNGELHTFVELQAYDHQNDKTVSCGKLAFPGERLVLDKRNFMFVELYSELTKISDTPKGTVSMGNFNYQAPGKGASSRVLIEEAFALYNKNKPQWARASLENQLFKFQFGLPYARRYHWEYENLYVETLK